MEIATEDRRGDRATRRRGEGGPSSKRAAAWLFTLPGLLTQFFFGWFPVLFAFVVGFQRYYFVKPPQNVGTANFKSVFADPLLLTVFKNTFYYTALSIGVTFVIPIFVSILLMEMSRRTIRWMMILWFIPVASTAGIAIWKYMYHPRLGLLNGLPTFFGGPRWNVQWLDDPRLAMFCLVLPGVILFGPGLVYNPASVTVKPGGYVRWLNNSGTAHTVTSN